MSTRRSCKPVVHLVRLAQRIPVRIRLTQVPEGVLVSAGMTCTVLMKDGMPPRIGASMKYLIAFDAGSDGGAATPCAGFSRVWWRGASRPDLLADKGFSSMRA